MNFKMLSKSAVVLGVVNVRRAEFQAEKLPRTMQKARVFSIIPSTWVHNTSLHPVAYSTNVNASFSILSALCSQELTENVFFVVCCGLMCVTQ